MGKTWLYVMLLFLLPRVAGAQNLFPTTIRPAEASPPVTGTPLLFNDWVRAKVVSHSPFFENDSVLLFNFNLSNQMLLATADKQTEYKISRKEFQAVTFYYGDATFTFEHVPVINDRDLFCEVVSKDDGYSLFTLIQSTIRGRAYVESSVYYIVFPKPDGRVVRLNTIDKRLIRHAFALNPDRGKVETYFSEHAGDELNGYFLKKLIEYLDE